MNGCIADRDNQVHGRHLGCKSVHVNQRVNIVILVYVHAQLVSGVRQISFTVAILKIDEGYPRYRQDGRPAQQVLTLEPADFIVFRTHPRNADQLRAWTEGLIITAQRVTKVVVGLQKTLALRKIGEATAKR